MSAERDDSVRAAADAVSAGKATKETVDALLGRPHPTADSAIERGPATPEDRFAELARLTSAYMDAPEEAMLRRAFEFARDAHAGQCRKSGEPFIIHPIEVGIILADLRMDAETITAALLHDTVEDTKVTAEEVERTFNPQVRALVEGVTKITRIEVCLLYTSGGELCLEAPFVTWSKADIVREGLALGVPYELTWSCYEGGEAPCGRCDTCLDRAAAFAANGVEDPAMR